MGKIIKYGIAAVALFALARGCGCTGKKDSEPEKKLIAEKVYDISESISNAHIKNSYVSTLQKMGEAKGLITQYMTDETISVNLDSQVRNYLIKSMRDNSISSGFNMADYMESFSEFVKNKKNAARTLDNIVNTYDNFIEGFKDKETEDEFMESYIEDKEKHSQFVGIGKSIVVALNTISKQYQKDQKYFDNLAKSIGQEDTPEAEKLKEQMSNYSNMCKRMGATFEHQKQRIAVEVGYIDSIALSDTSK